MILFLDDNSLKLIVSTPEKFPISVTFSEKVVVFRHDDWGLIGLLKVSETLRVDFQSSWTLRVAEGQELDAKRLSTRKHYSKSLRLSVEDFKEST